MPSGQIDSNAARRYSKLTWINSRTAVLLSEFSSTALRSPRVRAAGATEPRKPRWRPRRIAIVGFAEFRSHVPFLLARQPHVHPHQHGEHRQRQQRRPLHEEAEHHQDEADILRVTDVAIWPSDCEDMTLLGIEERAPGRGDQHETCADQHETQNMKWPKVRVRLPAKHHLEQVSGVVREPVDARIPGLQPAREEIDAQWKAVHLGE